MKCYQMFAIICITTLACCVMCGCARVTPKENRYVDIEYPQVPPDYPFTVIWKRSEGEKARITDLDQHILLDLVLIKCWNEGDHDFKGATISHETGKVYPLYKDVAYVTWDESKRPDGTIYRYVSSVLTVPDVDSDKISAQLENGEIPEEIKIVDYASAGINPFEYLGIDEGDVIEKPNQQH